MKALAGRDTSGCRRICAQNVSHKKKGPGAQRVMKALGRKGYSGLPTVLCAECVACTGQNSRTMEGQPACMRAHMGQSGGANGRARVPPCGREHLLCAAGQNRRRASQLTCARIGAERGCQRPSPGTPPCRRRGGRAGVPKAEPGYPLCKREHLLCATGCKLSKNLFRLVSERADFTVHKMI